MAPITDAGQTEREIYLPEGNLWYDMWTGREYKGGQMIWAAAPLEKIPLFTLDKKHCRWIADIWEK